MDHHGPLWKKLRCANLFAAIQEGPQGSTEVLNLLHRGDFRPGAALPSPALPPDPCSELLAARSSCLAGGVPDLPSPRLRAAAAGRHSPLRLQDRLWKTPLLSEDGNLYNGFVT